MKSRSNHDGATVRRCDGAIVRLCDWVSCRWVVRRWDAKKDL